MTEPWIITCETCHSRLRVRSAAAIGSILACPKCQSLVHVAQPEASEESQQADVAGCETGAPGTAVSKTRSVRLAAGVACGVVTMVVAIAVLLRQSPDEKTALAAQAAASDPPRESSAEPSVVPQEPGDARKPQSSDLPGSADASPSPAVTPTISVQDAATAAVATPDLPALPDLPANSAAAGRPPADSTRDQLEQRGVPAIGVPALDMDLSDIATPAPPSPAPVPDKPSSAAGPAAADPSTAPTDLAGSGPPASSIVRLTLELVDMGSGATILVDPGQALSLPLVDVAIDGLSCLQVVQLVGDMTGVTITLTPAAFEIARATPSAAWGRLSATTAGQVLTTVLEQRGLRAEQRGTQLVVVPRAEPGENATPVTWQPGPPSAKLRARLDAPVTYSFTDATPLEHVLRHIQQSSHLTLLIDWEGLADLGLAPATLVTTSVVHQPLQDVLDELFPQVGIGWQPVGDDAVWLTARP